MIRMLRKILSEQDLKNEDDSRGVKTGVGGHEYHEYYQSRAAAADERVALKGFERQSRSCQLA